MLVTVLFSVLALKIFAIKNCLRWFQTQSWFQKISVGAFLRPELERRLDAAGLQVDDADQGLHHDGGRGVAFQGS